jgi:hypothetical protein
MVTTLGDDGIHFGLDIALVTTRAYQHFSIILEQENSDPPLGV